MKLGVTVLWSDEAGNDGVDLEAAAGAAEDVGVLARKK